MTCQGVSINNNMENFSIDCRGKTVNQNNHNSHLPEPETETMTQALKIFMLIVTLCRTRKVSPNFFEVDCYILFRFPVSSTIIDPLFLIFPQKYFSLTKQITFGVHHIFFHPQELISNFPYFLKYINYSYGDQPTMTCQFRHVQVV